MAAFADGTTLIRDAAELRIKESDRLVALADNLSRMGVKCGVMEDGLAVEGRKDPVGADFASFGDHRIAMAFSIASLFLDGPSTIDDDSVVAVSCPDFYDILSKIIS
jgi:3-phosphoshikimate 1-carboxyvinyltransferase